MTPKRLATQLESELAQVELALADTDLAAVEKEGYTDNVSPDWTEGYWVGRRVGLRNALHELKELHD
jgi:hypothetical protein